jgi:hypothetical protein
MMSDWELWQWHSVAADIWERPEVRKWTQKNFDMGWFILRKLGDIDIKNSTGQEAEQVCSSWKDVTEVLISVLHWNKQQFYKEHSKL